MSGRRHVPHVSNRERRIIKSCPQMGRRARQTTSRPTVDISAGPELDEDVVGNVDGRTFTVRKATKKRKLSV